MHLRRDVNIAEPNRVGRFGAKFGMQTKPPAQTFRDVGCASLSTTERHIEAYTDAATAGHSWRADIGVRNVVGELYQPFLAGARFLGAIPSETPIFVAF
jgi:hypothetical protein